MGSAIRFWFIKGYDKLFENILDVIREALNDAGARDYMLKAFEVTAESGYDEIHREITGAAAGKIRGINLGLTYETLAPPAAPRPEIAQLIQFRDFISPIKQLENVLPPESLMEFTAQVSHKVGEIMLMNADRERADGYIIFKEGRIVSYGFKYGGEFIIRYHRGEYALDLYKAGRDFDARDAIGVERLQEAVEKARMAPCAINTYDDSLPAKFWQVANEGFNIFYDAKLGSLGTWEVNISTLHNVADPGIGHYDIYPDGISYAYPNKTTGTEKKKPWWKPW